MIHYQSSDYKKSFSVFSFKKSVILSFIALNSVFLTIVYQQTLPSTSRILHIEDKEVVNDSNKRIILLPRNDENDEIMERHRKPACTGLTQVIQYTNLSTPMIQMFQGKLLCKDLKRIIAARDKILESSDCTFIEPIVVNITFSCYDVFYHQHCGTGNAVQLIYAVRVTARIYGNVDVIFTCTDADAMKKELVLPWLMGTFPAVSSTIQSNDDIKNIIPFNSTNLCGRYYVPPVSYMYREIISDLRKMAIQLLGTNISTYTKNNDRIHPSVLYAEKNFYSLAQTIRDMEQVQSQFGTSQLPMPNRLDLPLVAPSEYELDDTVVHFRCGDLMDSTHPKYSFMTFHGYTRHISPEARTIGIITQPFEVSTQSRSLDSQSYILDRCYIVVHSLVRYIQERHPNAKVTIHNNRDETIALTYARMIMANQTIIGQSSFSVTPAIATFGTGYIRLPTVHGSPNRWLLNPRIDTLVPNVILFEEENIILVKDLKQLWEEEGEVGVLSWFWNSSIDL